MTDQHIATFLFALPFLTLCAGGLIAQAFAIRSEIARLRTMRVKARNEVRR